MEDGNQREQSGREKHSRWEGQGTIVGSGSGGQRERERGQMLRREKFGLENKAGF